MYRRFRSDWWTVLPFIDDMAGAMARATVVVCRAGASTLAELAAAGRCALLIPFPFASDDHQAVNAKSLADRGAARVLLQAEMNAQSLFQNLLELFRHPEQRRNMESAIRQFSNSRSAEMIIDLALGCLHEIAS
jgi:UDP-N-acetylglucosamine--N-acetylmuramyl-(pentapeptide) pyrophosphoryl-undecaprenol N-acetylglucosamine transferase